MAKLLGSESTVFLGNEAREAKLKAAKASRVLHLVTHGFSMSDQEFKAEFGQGEFRFCTIRVAKGRKPEGMGEFASGLRDCSGGSEARSTNH